MNFMKRPLLQQIFLAAFVLLSGTSLFAQTISGSIVGTVKDPTAALVVGAEIIVTNQGTGLTTQAITNAAGEYTVSDLPPGSYKVKGTHAGLAAQEVLDVDLQASRSMRVDLNLSTGEVRSTVVVSARAATVNSEDPTIGSVLQGAIIPTLPVNGRTVDKLLKLSAGVTSDNSSSGTNPRIGGSSYYGGTQFNVDGLTFNDASTGGAAYSTQGLNTMPSIDAIEELKVDSNNAKPEYEGSVSVTVVTKSGTDKFHGAVWEFNRNKALALKNAFAGTLAKPKFNRNEYGGQLDGPIFKNKLFFMGYYEGYSERSARVTTLSVSTAAERTGDFSVLLPSSTAKGVILINPITKVPYPNNVIPASSISPIATAILAFSPLPNLPGLSSNLVENVPNAFNTHRFGGKLDYHLGGKDRFSVAYYRAASGEYASALGYPTTYGNFSNGGFSTYGINGSWIHIVSAKTVNEARFGYFHHKSIRLGTNQNFDASTLISNLNTPLPYGGIPEVRESGYSNIGDYGGVTSTQGTYQFVDNISRQQGTHNLKAGFNIVHDDVARSAAAFGLQTGQGNEAVFGRFDFTGQYSGNAVADLLLGYPNTAYRSTPATPAEGVNPHYSFYVQDDWHVRSNLTITYGFRYQLQEPWSLRNGTFTNFDPKLNALVVQGQTFPSNASQRLISAYGILNESLAGYSGSYFQRDTADFAPRLGFAYRPTADGRISIRSGVGIFYNLYPFGEGPSQIAQQNPPFFLAETFESLAGNTPSLTLAQPFGGAGKISANPSIYGIARKLQNGRSYQWNGSIDNQITNDIGLRLSYVGNRTNHLLWNGENINLPNQQRAGTQQSELPYQPWAGISYSSFGGDAVLHQLQAEAIMRTRLGLNFQAEYSWTRSIDDVPINGGPQNPNNNRGDRGNSDALHRHVFNLGYSYQLPFGPGKAFLNHRGAVGTLVGGWQLSGINTLETGAPFNVSFNSATSGWLSSRADLVGQITQGARTRQHWFNTAAFAVPTPFTYGNSPRNGTFAPASIQIDASVLKNISFTERLHMQFRAEAFNIINRVNLGTPSANVSVASSFGVISSAGDPRQIQFGLKAMF